MPTAQASPPIPKKIAIVRFSALGDVVLTLPVVRSLQQSFPDSEITWITSPMGLAMMEGLKGVSFVVCDKPRSFADYRSFYRRLRARSFDVVLAMQANLRINLLYPALHAPRKIGFDRMRAREGQWLFCNEQIEFAGAHLLDGFMGFARRLGAGLGEPQWSLPLAEADREWAHEQVRGLPRPIIAVHPCSSKPERNWPFERYGETVRLAMQRWQCGFVFTGGNSELEQRQCSLLAELAGERGVNICGRSTPKQLAAVLEIADALVSPDTAAVHLARAADTPVVGLYAVAPPELSGPYGRQEYVINRYPDAVRKYLKRDPEQLPWNTRVHHPDAMKLIEVADVLAQLERLVGHAR